MMLAALPGLVGLKALTTATAIFALLCIFDGGLGGPWMFVRYISHLYILSVYMYNHVYIYSLYTSLCLLLYVGRCA